MVRFLSAIFGSEESPADGPRTVLQPVAGLAAGAENRPQGCWLAVGYQRGQTNNIPGYLVIFSMVLEIEQVETL